MKIATFVFNKVINSKGIINKFWNYLRKILIIILNDPSCLMLIHGKLLNLPLSHQLPIHLNNSPNYDRQIGRAHV